MALVPDKEGRLVNVDGYPAFVAWCMSYGVQACSRELYETWTTRRLDRYMREQFKLRDSPVPLADPTSIALF